jgi:hypothetical protein
MRIREDRRHTQPSPCGETAKLTLETEGKMHYRVTCSTGTIVRELMRSLQALGRWKTLKRTLVLAIILFQLGATASSAARETFSLPKGYEKWEKSRQKVVSDKKSPYYGIYYIQADRNTLKAYKTGGAYPEGSRFVVTYYGMREEGGKPLQGKKNIIVLMKKERKQALTGGWLFAGFTPAGKPASIDPARDCYGCHLKEAGTRDLVISTYADFRQPAGKSP